MVALPFASLSAFVMGFGASLAAFRAAVNTTVFGWVLDGCDGLLLPQAAARTAIPTRTYRFMWTSPFENQNLRVMLKPRYTSCGFPPRASWPNVVPNEFVKFSWRVCPPVRFSTA